MTDMDLPMTLLYNVHARWIFISSVHNEIGVNGFVLSIEHDGISKS